MNQAMTTATYYQSFVLVTIFRKENLDKSAIAKKRISESNLLHKVNEIRHYWNQGDYPR